MFIPTWVFWIIVFPCLVAGAAHAGVALREWIGRELEQRRRWREEDALMPTPEPPVAGFWESLPWAAGALLVLGALAVGLGGLLG